MHSDRKTKHEWVGYLGNKRFQALIFVVCYISYASIYIARISLTMASPELIRVGVLSASQFGMIGSVFSVIYASGRLLTGAIADKTKPALLVCLGLAVAGVSTILVGTSLRFYEILIFWGLNAFAQSMIWGSILCTISAISTSETA